MQTTHHPIAIKRIVIIAYSNKLPTLDDYINNFIEEFYVKEFEQRVYLHIGPVVEIQREVWVLNNNSICAADLNNVIVIRDLTLHMTNGACKICLEKVILTNQLSVAEALTPRSIRNHMMLKYVLEDSKSEDNIGTDKQEI